MVRNNHFDSTRKKLDALLRSDDADDNRSDLNRLLDYARLMAEIEGVIVVVSDMADGKSYIASGRFASALGISDYRLENSIWENRILSLMPPEVQEEKYLAELKFHHHVCNLPKRRKANIYLLTKLRFSFADGCIRDVLHRMHYIFDEHLTHVRFAICIYGPLTFDFNGRCQIVDSITGLTEALSLRNDESILSRRERQVLSLIDTGMKSADIASHLNISIHTVSRHRQEIIAKLRVKNTHEACRIAKALHLI